MFGSNMKLNALIQSGPGHYNIFINISIPTIFKYESEQSHHPSLPQSTFTNHNLVIIDSFPNIVFLSNCHDTKHE